MNLDKTTSTYRLARFGLPSLMGAAFILLASGSVLAAGPERPETAPTPPIDRFAERPFALYADFGFGLPTGIGGVTFEYSPTHLFILQTGIGANLESPQGAVALGGRVHTKRIGLAFLAGYSVGEYRPVSFCLSFSGCGGGASAKLTHWLNGMFEFQFRSTTGFAVRVQVGYAVSVGASRETELPFFGGGVGYSF